MIRTKRIIRYIFYIIGFTLIDFFIFFPYKEIRMLGAGDGYYSQATKNFYNSFSRPGFVFALSMILSGPLVGKNGFMRFILGSRGLVPWARLTFIIYMIHIPIYMWFYSQMRQSSYISYKPIFNLKKS